MIPIMPEMFRAFDVRTRAHMKQVDYFARLIGQDFPDHDQSKYDSSLLNGFVLAHALNNSNIKLDEEDIQIRARSIFNHVKRERHHPEYWDENLTWKNYITNPRGFNCHSQEHDIYRIDARKMDEKAILEMCADLCAVGNELGNNPSLWIADNLQKRWLFKPNQEKLIHTTLNTLWKEHTHHLLKNNTFSSLSEFIRQQRFNDRK